MDENTVSRLLLDSITNPSPEITEKLQEFVLDQNCPFILLNILQKNSGSTLQKASLLYLYRYFKGNIVHLQEEIQLEIQNQLLNILNSNFNPDTYQLIADNLSYLYEHDVNQYPGLLDFVSACIQNPDRYYFGIFLLSTLIKNLKAETCENLWESFMNVSLEAMHQSDVLTIYRGFHIYVELANKISITTDILGASENHIQRISELPDLIGLSEETYSISFWDDIGELNRTISEIYSDFAISMIEKAVSIAESNDFPTKLRVACLEIVYSVQPIPIPLVKNTITACFNVCAKTMEEDGSVQEDRISLIESAMFEYPGEEICSFIGELIDQYIDSDNVTYQATALLAFRAIFTNAANFAFKNIDKIIYYLQTAVSDETSPILQAAACKVLSHFDEGFKSLTCYSAKFISPLIQILLTQNTELTTHAYQALEAILSKLDTQDPDLFDTIYELREKVTYDDISYFIKILALSIPNTSDFDDENADTVIKLIEEVVSTYSLDVKASCFDLAVQLVKVDSAQLETLNEYLLPVVYECIKQAYDYICQQDNPELSQQGNIELSLFDEAISAVDYISGLITFLKEEAFMNEDVLQSLMTFIDPILHFVSKLSISKGRNSLIKSSLRCLSRIAKIWGNFKEDENSQIIEEPQRELLDKVFPAVFDGIRNLISQSRTSMQKTAIECALKIRHFLNDEMRFDFYKKIIEIINEEAGKFLFIRDCFFAASKFLRMSNEMAPEYIKLADEVCSNVVSGEITFLEGNELKNSGAASFVFPAFCTLCSALLELSSPISNDIVEYLLQWYHGNDEQNNSDDELAKFEVSRAFIAILDGNAVSEETTTKVLQSVLDDIEKASEPSLQQNIVYFLNLLVQRYDHLIQIIKDNLGAIDNWYQYAKDNKVGYQDLLANIASFYLSLAVKDNLDNAHCLAALEQFPPYDTSEAKTMCQNIIILYNNRKLVGELAKETAYAIARLITWDDEKAAKADVEQETLQQLIDIFRNIVSQNQQVLNEIQKLYSKMKQKKRKLAEVLN